MFDCNALDAARKVSFPVCFDASNFVNCRTLIRCEITIPTQVNQHLHRELWVTISQLCTWV